YAATYHWARAVPGQTRSNAPVVMMKRAVLLSTAVALCLPAFLVCLDRSFSAASQTTRYHRPVQPRRLFALILVLVVAGCRREAPATRPNILFILLDDLRWNAVGYAGHPYVKTPQIDRIANEGVNFKNAFCTTSLCSPSRASLLTGLYAHKHGVTNNFTELPSSV